MVLYDCRLPDQPLPYWTGDSIYSEPVVIEKSLEAMEDQERPSMVLVRCGSSSCWIPWRYSEKLGTWVPFLEED